MNPLMSQALRAAAPGIEPLPAPVVRVAATAAPAPIAATAAAANDAPVAVARHTAPAAHAQTLSAALNTPTQHQPAPVALAAERAEPARESLISRARAIFRIGDAPNPSDGPTLAELVTTAEPRAHSAMVAPVAAPVAPPIARTLDIRVDDAVDIDETLAHGEQLAEAAPTSEADTDLPQAAPTAAAAPAVQPEADFESLIAAFGVPAVTPASPATAAPMQTAPVDRTAPAASASEEPAPATSPYAQTSDADYLIALSSPCPTPVANAESFAAPRTLQVVPAARVETPDPTIIAMRDELASMRALMEKQMESLSLERLRGSPARAAVLDALLGFGCDDALAQSIAASIDPRLAGRELQAAMAAQFAQAMPVLRAEPIEDGGVIALVGPTGAGKTTTAAKLAARFAARHRARDVALVSIDRERTGAREQLHAYGRRHGVTVCDAESSDELGQALDQLVDYPLVLVDTTGYGVRDRALLRQILWLRSSSRLRSLLVLPANANPHDLGEIARRYRPAAPVGVVLTKLDETGRAGAALSVLAQQGLPLAYTSAGQQLPHDLQAADAAALAPPLASPLEKTTRAAVNPLATEDRHAFA
ncbi:flagellar biosynthesis protein FlhF [Agrilutibacter solisilvae]|uniref:Flagellar biosynthesis protein FlhF n=1 Tax=Agrilutibacter solisilvae TaxID=2763317 RepID=A0A974XXG5_9GAMM|nr:flagellar biosynthesis protein FlhF [Lysobacter solisilvae]QSX77597.1 flagellar biosynthesis protein FlhF [Lysobacter solisilvae]